MNADMRFKAPKNEFLCFYVVRVEGPMDGVVGDYSSQVFFSLNEAMEYFNERETLTPQCHVTLWRISSNNNEYKEEFIMDGEDCGHDV